MFVGESVVRVRRVPDGVDRYGNPTFTLEETTLTGCAFDPGGTQEPTQVGREQVVTEPKAFFPRQYPDVASGDVLRVRGVDYEVQGHPARWVSPFAGVPGGLVVDLKRGDG